MTRAEFLEDARNASHPQLTDFKLQADDTFTFTFTDPHGRRNQIVVMVLAKPTYADASLYPTRHHYLIWGDDNVSDDVSQSIQSIQSSYDGQQLSVFLPKFADCLTGSAGHDNMEIGPHDMDLNYDVGSEMETGSEDEDLDYDISSEMDCDANYTSDWTTIHERLGKDLRAAKSPGIKPGFLGELEGRIIITISCRVAKLNILKDALQLWDVSPSDYLVLLIEYPQRYCGLDQISPFGSRKKPNLYVGLCDSYKPTMESALQVLHPPAAISSDSTYLNVELAAVPDKRRMRSSFVTEMLTDLFNERLLEIIHYRVEQGYSWTGAELYYETHQGQKPNAADGKLTEYSVKETWGPWIPAFVQQDDLLLANINKAVLSFPRIAMQYTLRRFTRASEFCLICYCKTEEKFRALSPYVCSKELCLFQYLEYGKGPKLEWQIVNQPEVIDLLVSFAYRRATEKCMTDCPNLPLKVPHPELTTKRAFQAKLTGDRLVGPLRLKVGDWILVFTGHNNVNIGPIHYCVVADANGEYVLSEPIAADKDLAQTFGTQNVLLYETPFEDLTLDQKQLSIVHLLDTLPDIDSMVTFIRGNSHHHRKLASWGERVSPAALCLLRWIVSSNTACIFLEKDAKINGMENHMQFRLAQGSPEKEQRFVDAVRQEGGKTKYPTLFAWHGSGVGAWHSILRQGLNFDRIKNGRAYGNGVYLAQNYSLAEAYTTRDPCGYRHWPSSKLKIVSAISLNEVVNAPSKFVKAPPHPYVITQTDWIMARYLFVRCSDPLHKESSQQKPQEIYLQDPKYTARGPDDRPVDIPRAAVSTHSAQAQLSPSRGDGSRQLDAGYESDATLDEDRAFLESYPADSEADPLAAALRQVLRTTNLRLLPPPCYATSQATKRLNWELKLTAELQKQESLANLGWYIDHETADNPYQWLVALHSFESTLPLAHDLAATESQCVLVEIRFPSSFPFSPPFIRVVRPRFLPLAAGGGGHVTTGGAICMDLLTSSGWNAAYSLESILLEVRLALSSKDPHPARLDRQRTHDYSWGEAVEAYKRACRIHGWKVPEDFDQMQQA
ncbi:putative ubiquitin conjugating enzyme [Aspergillus saccharolyticus JOP 1030-1]|uniref:UBC core domain-containing protein n=1 Tax=Aspergillus saccharolyticus JOP 1030-1 TaxID=1450539 RepID=A0A318ZE49_9EURO|nr:hypothetical protein BP01DRAFT_400184 [Aspergillus saccharolyticus JOP 1030-1]PYH44554.1 hypothetical protein BP01DRAFT_400184 [Aspergillus saccharolyticus JOP 1030-1]